MNYLLILNKAMEFSIITPGIFICLMPVTKWIKVPLKKLWLPVTAGVLAFCFISGAVSVFFRYYPSVFFYPTMLVCLLLYFRYVNLERIKLLFLFLCTIAALTFGGLANDITEAMINPDRDMHGFYYYGLMVQYLISLAFLIVFFIFRKKLTWLFENFHSAFLWRMICIVPALVSFCNLSMSPADYHTLFVGRIFELYLIIETCLLAFFLIFLILFYLIARAVTEKYQTEKTVLMYQMQMSQYHSLKNYMEQTSRIRHDFRHIMITTGELLQTKQYDKLKQYADDYCRTFSDAPSVCHFCKHASANALLSYYASIAADHKITIQFQIQIPENISVSDIDLSILLGNLLENAVFACKTAEPTKRYIHLTADTNTPGALFIVMANSFDGKIKKSNGGFLSTKEGGSAIGLSSVRAIAEKYQGFAQFSADKTEFISNVMLKY